MINYLLTKLQRLFNCTNMTDQQYEWWVNAGRPTFMVYNNQERRVADLPRPEDVPWDETYERRNNPHTYEETLNG